MPPAVLLILLFFPLLCMSPLAFFLCVLMDLWSNALSFLISGRAVLIYCGGGIRGSMLPRQVLQLPLCPFPPRRRPLSHSPSKEPLLCFLPCMRGVHDTGRSRSASFFFLIFFSHWLQFAYFQCDRFGCWLLCRVKLFILPLSVAVIAAAAAATL